jgi:hypothetical protein
MATQTVTPEEYKAMVRSRWSEEEFTREVIDLAKRNGWRSAHFRPGRTAKGDWRTAVQGDGKGFPDLLLVRGPRQVNACSRPIWKKAAMIVAELKVGTNRASNEQLHWLEAFDKIDGVHTFIWYPHDWNEIERVLGS